jgi:diaminohydroxyphosphoribosylaminopyrimidine deaminase / 5-amino-6-(5-phosphoribosylamino)uracil reductase
MTHHKYMQQALDLALKGLGGVSPNPMVGCVIIYEDEMIGQGWHKEFGGAHAEVNAVKSVKDKGLLAASTFYVTLEPCSYHGKTPACTDLILKYKPKKVVIAAKDPNPKVSGRGIIMLQEAGIEVVFGILEKESISLNRHFYVSMNRSRPYVILKWAQTADGFVARKNYDSKWISNEESRQLVHKWRTEEDAVLVGFNTVKYDNPRLTARSWPGRNPARIIIDYNLSLDLALKIFAGDEKVYVFNTSKDHLAGNIYQIKVSPDSLLDEMLKYLWQQNIGSVIVEGGSSTLNKFLKEGYWDEARVFTALHDFGEGIVAPTLEAEGSEELSIGDDRLRITYNPKTGILWQKK